MGHFQLRSALGVLVTFLALQGCQPPKMHVLAKTLSPDRQKIAYVLEEDPFPLVSTDTLVLVKPVNRELDKEADLVFRGGDVNGRGFGPVNVRWLPDGSLWIGYCSGRISAYHNY